METEIEMKDEIKVCRLCMNASNEEELIAPCGCDGHNKWVHRSCLNSYRIFYNDPVAFGKCLVCGVDYTYKHVVEHSIGWLITKMIFKLIFQVTMLFIELIGLFYLVGIIPYALDAGSFHIFIHENDPKWFQSCAIFYQMLLYGLFTCCFMLGLWSIAGMLKRCMCKSEYKEELEYHDTQRIGTCCSLTLCCMPFIYKQSFLYKLGCCQCCECCPNTCYNCYDCGDCLACCICCDCCTDCCFVSPYHPHYFIWMPHPLFYRPPHPSGDCCCCCGPVGLSGIGNSSCGGCKADGDAGKVLLVILIVIVLVIIFIGVVVGLLSFFVFLGYIIKMNFEYIKKQAESEIWIIDNWDPSVHPMPVRDPPGMQPQVYNQQFMNVEQQYAQPLNPAPMMYNQQQMYPPQQGYLYDMPPQQDGVIYDVPPPASVQNYQDPMIPQ